VFNAFGSQEKDSTQNQLLAEIDVSRRKNITSYNRCHDADENQLDTAMLRPGRSTGNYT